MRTRDIVVLSVVLCLSFVSVMFVVARSLFIHQRPAKAHNEDRSGLSVEPLKRSSSPLLAGNKLRKLFTLKQERGQLVPTLSAIVKAGDEAIYSSTLFSALQGHPGIVPLETLYNSFANELRVRPTSERSNYSPTISAFLSTTKKPLQRSQSAKVHGHNVSGRPQRRTDDLPRPQRTSIDLAEIGLGRSRAKRVGSGLISMGNAPRARHEAWANDLQHAPYPEGGPGLAVAASDLAALSIILGTPIHFAAEPSGEKIENHKTVDKGAHGISICGAAIDDKTYHITLTQHKRSIAQLPARGSGYSSLFAKHLASGSLPFCTDSETVNAILITNETTQALKAGTHFHIQSTTPQTCPAIFLANLPHSKLLAFHTLTPSPTPEQITTSHTLICAITALPFNGGLTPLASTPLLEAVQFIASGGLVPGRLLQRLDALVEKAHRHSPQLQLFGPLLEDRNAGLRVREREKLGKLATGALSSANEPLADKVARIHRYITLIERLMYLIPDMSPQDALAAVKEEVRAQLERAYHDAVFSHATVASPPGSPVATKSKRRSSLSQLSRSHSKYSKHSSDTSFQNIPTSLVEVPRNSVAFSRCSSTFPPCNLGSSVEDVLKIPLPLDVTTVAMVVRMVVVAWTLSTGVVAWNGEEDGFEVPHPDEEMPGTMILC